jgi:hypothetical protein
VTERFAGLPLKMQCQLNPEMALVNVERAIGIVNGLPETNPDIKWEFYRRVGRGVELVRPGIFRLVPGLGRR